jgi:hypothetical protein
MVGAAVIRKGQQPTVGDGEEVRAAREVVQHMLRSAKRGFRADHPAVPERRWEELREHLRCTSAVSQP